MNMRIQIPALIALIFSAQTALGADAGSVLFATGSVSAERQPPEALSKGDAVEVNDTIVTGSASRAQLLMSDGAKVAIRPDSRLRIDAYAYAAAAPKATLSTSKDSSVMTLVKGGFRSITGAIGKNDHTAYQVRTPVGVLGIRGTDYSAVFCNGDCDWAPGVGPGSPIEDGLYIGVTQGGIRFVSSVATIDVSAGEFAFIPLRTQQPEMLTLPPPVLQDNSDLSFAAGTIGTNGKTKLGFDATIDARRGPSENGAGQGADNDEPGRTRREDASDKAKQPIIATDPDGIPIDITPGNLPSNDAPRSLGFTTAIGGRQVGFLNESTDNDPSQVQTDAENNLTGFTIPAVASAGPAPVGLDIGTASNVNTGFDSITVMRWGRWSGGDANVALSDGSSVPLDLNTQSLHWISGPQAAAPAMPVTGIATYTLIGGTSPTDNLGNVGTLGGATFVADFTNQIVTSTLNITIGGSTWSAAGTGVIGDMQAAHLFSGAYSDVNFNAVGGGTGVFSGFFSAPGDTSDPSFPGGAGLTYNLTDGQGTSSVSGAAAFGNP